MIIFIFYFNCYFVLPKIMMNFCWQCSDSLGKVHIF